MNETDQRIAIAAALGWRDVEKDPFTEGIIWGSQPEGHNAVTVDRKVPDFLNDLNAMHEAEKVLSFLDERSFLTELGRIVGSESQFEEEVRGKADIFDMIHATAAQRAEAFLRTLNLWKEDK